MEIRNIYDLLCRIVRYSSEPNTKVYGDGHTRLKHSFPFRISSASDNGLENGDFNRGRDRI